ncbi:hypothetical protein [Roseixanthobacter pseudopolyaromaticivorans]|uniref:hypothetical protein n=1 Tax=Xanthobacteraceae TaxID=335928 RepID=UPI003729AD9A
MASADETGVSSRMVTPDGYATLVGFFQKTEPWMLDGSDAAILDILDDQERAVKKAIECGVFIYSGASIDVGGIRHPTVAFPDGFLRDLYPAVP